MPICLHDYTMGTYLHFEIGSGECPGVPGEVIRFFEEAKSWRNGMPSSAEHLEAFSRADLIRTIQGLEADLSTAASGLMTDGSKQELAFCQQRIAVLEKERNILFESLEKDFISKYRLPRLIRWWCGC